MLEQIKDKKGFTLIELATVMLIIGILASITIPNFISFAEKAKESAIKENMHVIQKSIEMYAMENGNIYPTQAQEADFVQFCPKGQYPVNPFTKEVGVVVWNADPVTPGVIGISNLPNGGYRIKGYGAKALLFDALEQSD